MIDVAVNIQSSDVCMLKKEDVEKSIFDDVTYMDNRVLLWMTYSVRLYTNYFPYLRLLLMFHFNI